MKNQRRKFIQMGAMLGMGAAFMPLQFCAAPKKKEGDLDETVKSTLSAFGIQLYSVKEDMAVDAQATMRSLAGFGYKQFEGFDGGKGILWGMQPAEFKSLLSETGTTMVASHANVFENLEAQAAQAAEVGMKYLICPWIGPQKSLDDYKKKANEFNQIGEKLKSFGLRFAYHNHDYTFVNQEGSIPQDILMDNTDPELVDFEMDIYWVHVANAKPAEYLAKYPGRFRLCHLKDAESGTGDPHQRGVLLGAGEIPYADLIKQSKAIGMEYFIVEQERFPSGTPMEAAETNAKYLSALEY
ncbi:MAG: sugar phosphate isomerase/epimerase [Algoriphagus sp.]|uniref:sugar phosphate isomerase/epimerase family protein n=1 Tax=Algoriphagus sp. TaxID=1872435 RepID=UPI002728EFE4|nr:sugar phosphate isomerase/epimerase [Algoriphagus sp.]MDO8965377.1 sugar phosphate isomerase/epimerase [Algoriphagus sp.]MDP2041210.1 sugar phosphate isomerase/epimerase [Algoriphagus sp.]MDP3198809.1 sugar phosphate isomerase/epimerase [Algoriphagus sp.]MDP3472235.1 sugar phosphate isomerase/epimerase [Algoriphagus sp.]